MTDLSWRVRQKIREIKNFPIHGVSFKDISPILEDASLFEAIIDELADHFADESIDKIVGIESRGFVLSSALAYRLYAGHVMARKKGKLPHKKVSQNHRLEYGESMLEMHVDSIVPGERVLIVDDLLATGGTAHAAVKLVKKLKGEVVALGFLIELPFGGREILSDYRIESLIKY